ncbi:BRCT domain-containing protein, partial [Helicobacter suis]|uniref:BRCT domain-containing protein n=1 Tax=Helicobacter suis TaxID=104628 RepID=UPI0013D1F694
SLRQLDSKIAAKRKLTFYPWGLGLAEEKYTSLKQSMQIMKDWGFLSLDFVLCESVQAIEESFKLFHARRYQSIFDADGMVVMLDDLYLQSILGFTIKSPRFGFAYKFPATEKHTKLLGVINQVGRSGVITPVARLEPITLEGARISKATLDNYIQIQQQDLMINDTVVIVRSGDVIPKIIKPLKHLRNGTQKPISPPTHCPACLSVLQKQPLNICPQCNLPLLLKNKPNFCPTCQIFFKKYTHCPVCQTLLGKRHKKCPQCKTDLTFPRCCLKCGRDLELREYCYRCDLDLSHKDRYLFCPNKNCTARLKESITYFASKNGLEIKGLGDKVVAQLLQAGLIKGVVDLYSLEEKALLNLEGWQQKKAQNLLQAIIQSKHAPLWRFISALGIEHIGKGASKTLAQHFGLEVFDKTYEEIASLEGFGGKGSKEEEKKIAASFVRFVKENKGFIEQLLALINPIASEKKVTPSFFKDKKIVITGSFKSSRAEITTLLENLGAHVQTGVSSKTDLLICGENPGSKLEKAKKLGVEVMEEIAFLERLKSEGRV